MYTNQSQPNNNPKALSHSEARNYMSEPPVLTPVNTTVSHACPYNSGSEVSHDIIVMETIFLLVLTISNHTVQNCC
jgi:hypothetical protein